MWLIILFIIGLFMIIKPDWLWKCEHFLSVKDGEPSDAYLAGMRIGGIFFLLASFLIFIFLV